MGNQKTIRVLIAEDDHLISESTAALLRDMGYAVVGQAVNGREAVKMTQSLQPDVILMDLMMPVMDGIEATQRIHETCPTPVVALTAYDTPEVAERAIASGMGAYLTKPANAQEIERAIHITIARFDDMMELRRLNAELQAEIAERKRAEDALRESEERLKILFEFAPDAYYMSDLKGNFTDGNKAAEELTGYDRSELIGKSFLKLKLLPLEQIPKAAALLARNALGKATGPDEFVLNRKDGSQVPVEIRTFPVQIKGQTVVLGIARDITERKRVEDALRESARKFRLVTETIQDVFWMSTPGVTEMIHVSPAYERIWGRSVESLYESPRSFLEALHPEDLDRYLDVVEAFHAEGKAYECEYRIVPATGPVRWIHERGYPITDDQGNVALMTGICTDITEHKRAEEALRESEKRFRDLTEMLPEAIFETDRNNQLTYANRKAFELFGYSPEDMKADLSGFDMIVPAERKRAAENLTRKLKGDKIGAIEYTGLRKDGSTFPMLFNSNLIRKEGVITGFRGIIVDITERKRAEEVLERRTAQMATLNRIGHQVASILDQQELLQQAVDAAQEDLGYLQAAVLLLDEETSGLYVAAATDNFWEIIPDGYRQPVGQGAIGIAIETGETVLVKDASTDSRPYRVGEWLSPSSLSVPINVGGRVIGVLEVEADVPNAFDENDRAALETMADQIAIAIENARLYEAEAQQRQEAETLRETALALTTSLDRNQVIERILTQLQEVVPYDSASVQLLRQDQLVLIGGRGFPNLEELLGVSFSMDADIPNREVMYTLSPFIVDDAPLLYEPFTQQPFAAMGIRSWLGVPMLIGERPVGMITLDKCQPGFYTQEHARLAEAFAAQAAVAVENARLFEEIEERRMYLEGVLGAAPDAIVTLDAHHRIVEWNTGAERLFGYSQGEAIGQDIDDLVTSPDVFEEAVGFTQAAMSGRAVPPTETVRYRKDGSPVDVIVAGSPILVGDKFIGAVAVYTDITERVRMEEALRALALLDELTGLYNRRGFSVLAEHQLKMAERGNRRLLLLFADMDGMKQINDTFGHQEGDRALIETADILEETFRESDIVARIGGDEFVVLAVETNGSPAEVLVLRLRESLEARNAEADRRYELSLSVGVARYDPAQPCSLDDLLAQADRAMYARKRGNEKS